MAIDYTIPLRAQTGDFLLPLQAGMQLGEDFKNGGIRQQMLDQRVKLGDQAIQQNEQGIAQNNQQADVQKAIIAGQMAKVLKNTPPEQRQAVLSRINQQFGNTFSPDELGKAALDDQSLDQYINIASSLAPQSKGEGFTLSEGQVRFDENGNPIAGVEKTPDQTDTQPLVKDLRSRYDKFTADLRSVDAAYRKVDTAPATAAGDLSLIFNYMKMLDPGSTVREGEFANAQNAGGVGDKVINLYNNLLSGQRLNPEQRTQFKETAKTALDAQQAAADEQVASLLYQADQDGVARIRVLGEKPLRDFEKRMAERAIQQAKKKDLPPAELSDEELLNAF